jgi:hypothetical protein
MITANTALVKRTIQTARLDRHPFFYSEKGDKE